MVDNRTEGWYLGAPAMAADGTIYFEAVEGVPESGEETAVYRVGSGVGRHSETGASRFGEPDGGLSVEGAAPLGGPRPPVALMTIYDYDMVMKTVGIAELKAHLSQHLQAVRSGTTVVVLDRREPIARIVPIGAVGLELVVRPARGSIQEVELLGPTGSDGDVMAQLREERGDRL